MRLGSKQRMGDHASTEPKVHAYQISHDGDEEMASSKYMTTLGNLEKRWRWVRSEGESAFYYSLDSAVDDSIPPQYVYHDI